MASSDIVIIGGGAIGAAVACWLTAVERVDARVVVLERDPSHAGSSTARAASGIRTQFSTPLNIALSRFGLEVIRDFPAFAATPDGPGPDLAFRENGYLFLARPDAAEGLRALHPMQLQAGADVALLAPDALAARFPHLRTADLALASLGLSGEGWFDNMGLLRGLIARARAAGAEFRRAEAVALERDGPRIAAVVTADGARLPCATVVNAAGPAAGRVAALAGLHLPVEARKRTVFAFRTADPPPSGLPLTIDPTGVWHRPEGDGFIAGAPPADDPAVAPDDLEPRHAEFEDVLWPALAARSALFEAVKVTGVWAGHYEWNPVDRNGIVGPDPEVANLIHAAGFSGHGLQHAAGVGRGVAERIATGGWRTLDLSPLAPERLAQAGAAAEAAVI